jgi:hypothetical protein
MVIPSEACTAPQAQLDAYSAIVVQYDKARDDLDAKRQEYGEDGRLHPTPEQTAVLDQLGHVERDFMGKMLDAYREIPLGCRGALESPYR